MADGSRMPGPTAARASSPSIRAAAREFVAVAQRVWQRGLVSGSGGNMSLRVPGTSQVMIKPSGVAAIDCRPETLRRVNLQGALVAGAGRPSKDMGFHLGIYRARPDVGGVIHAHVPWATALTLLGFAELPLLTPHAQERLGRVAVLPYAPSASPELDALVTDAFRADRVAAVLLERHGMVAVGATLTAAEQVAEFVEETAQIAVLVHLGSRVTAGQPRGE